MLFTIFINLASHASIKYIVIPRKKTLCCIIGQIFFLRSCCAALFKVGNTESRKGKMESLLQFV